MRITNIKHTYQPSGNSCGPTCLYMLAECVFRKKHDLPWDEEFPHTIEDICNMCGTDWIVGTPPDRMEKGLNALKLPYVEYIHSPEPYELLRDTIQRNNVAIVRTITKGIPHWIIVNEYYPDENSYNVLDPWQGTIQYSEAQLDSVWKPRDYQFFEILTHDY